MNRFDFTNKVVVITGAGQGLGKAYAELLARHHAKLVINDIAVKDGTSLAKQLTDQIIDSGGDAIADLNSVAEEQGVSNLINNALAKYGRIDVLIHNAGILKNSAIAEMSTEDWKTVHDVHLNGTFHLVRSVFPIMIQQNYGRIVLVTSSAGLYGLPYQLNYAAAKMGVVGIVNALKTEISDKNICCNAISPLASSAQTIQALGSELEGHLSPALVAPIVVYLCSSACKENGNIYVGGGGYFSRIGVFEAEGIYLNPEQVSVDMIADRIDEINDMSGAKHISNILQAAKKILKTFMKNRKSIKV